ncbi:MAG TPA: hypothetical protein VGE19_04100 [Pseudoxanthomonas sp.]
MVPAVGVMGMMRASSIVIPAQAGLSTAERRVIHVDLPHARKGESTMDSGVRRNDGRKIP